MKWENSDKEFGIRYYEFCKNSIKDKGLLSTFKRHPDYTSILSHVTPEQGAQYLNSFVQKENLSRCDINFFIKENDRIGNPPLFSYPEYGSVDPTSFRYLKFVSDLRDLFGNLLGNVLEIGGGYGGLCLCINLILEPKTYTIKDHETVIPFVKKNLSNYEIELETEEVTFDTIISTFAWDELDYDLRASYLKYFKSSKRGFILGHTSKIVQHTWEQDVIFKKDEIIQGYSVATWNRQ